MPWWADDCQTTHFPPRFWQGGLSKFGSDISNGSKSLIFMELC